MLYNKKYIRCFVTGKKLDVSSIFSGNPDASGLSLVESSPGSLTCDYNATYTKAGTYTIECTATDTLGNTDTSTVSVTAIMGKCSALLHKKMNCKDYSLYYSYFTYSM